MKTQHILPQLISRSLPICMHSASLACAPFTLQVKEKEKEKSMKEEKFREPEKAERVEAREPKLTEPRMAEAKDNRDSRRR